MSDNLPARLETASIEIEVPGDLKSIFAQLVDVSPFCPPYLEGYYATGKKALTCKALGISESLPRKWKQSSPAFALLYDEVEECVNERWSELGDTLAVEGFEERMYDKQGNLAGRRVRIDPGYMKALLASKLPNWRPNEQSTEIQVNVLVRAE